MHKTTAGFFVVVKIIMCKSELAVQAHACQHQSPFYLPCKMWGLNFLQGVENFQQGEVLFVQATYKFLHAAKMHFMQL